MKWLFSLFICLTASAQLPVIPFRPTPSASIVLPNLNGIKFRYKASDLNSSPVSTWTDEISAFNWVQSGSGKPTWSAGVGVTFDGVSQFLVATNGIIKTDGTDTYLVVMKLNSIAANNYLMANGNFPNVIIAMDNTGTFYNPVAADIGGLTTGHYFDFLACKSAAAPTYSVFTNGVSGYSSGTQPWNNGGLAATLGAVGASGNASPAHFGAFILQEFVWWTNLAVVDATFVANVHKYATNTYNFTP